jgi:hypothetical protein
LNGSCVKKTSVPNTSKWQRGLSLHVLIAITNIVQIVKDLTIRTSLVGNTQMELISSWRPTSKIMDLKSVLNVLFGSKRMEDAIRYFALNAIPLFVGNA